MITHDSDWKARWLVLGIFLLGFFVGALTMDIYRATVRSERIFSFSDRLGHRDKDKRLEQLRQDLGLSPEQVKQVGQVLNETGKEFEQLASQVHPRFSGICRRSHERIRAFLTPQQIEKFDQLKKQRDKERRQSGKLIER